MSNRNENKLANFVDEQMRINLDLLKTIECARDPMGKQWQRMHWILGQWH